MELMDAGAQDGGTVMRDERRNHEGYHDPVPYEALRHVERNARLGFRPVVYICSPYAGDIETNTKNARLYSRFAVDKGAIPFAPHLLIPQYLDDNKPEERTLALFMNKVFLDKCAELWVFGSTISAGMREEIDRARFKQKRIRFFSEELKENTRT